MYSKNIFCILFVYYFFMEIFCFIDFNYNALFVRLSGVYFRLIFIYDLPPLEYRKPIYKHTKGINNKIRSFLNNCITIVIQLK